MGGKSTIRLCNKNGGESGQIKETCKWNRKHN